MTKCPSVVALDTSHTRESSSVNRWSTFESSSLPRRHVAAPIRALDRIDFALDSASVTLVRSSAARDARVLVVDDHAPNVEALSRILHRAGFAAVRGTTDPMEGVQLVREWFPDLILLDLHMPK